MCERFGESKTPQMTYYSLAIWKEISRGVDNGAVEIAESLFYFWFSLNKTL